MNLNRFLHRSTFLAALFLASPAFARIDIVAVSPRAAGLSADDLFVETSSGLHVAGLGEKVYLRASANQTGATLSDIQWTLTKKPSGSAVDFVINGQTMTAFVPDKTGEYQVALSAKSSSGATLNETVRVVGGTYDGAGNLTDAPPGLQCALCHTDNAKGWLKTNHAHVLENHLNGMRSDQYDESCFACHTTGFHAEGGIANKGFTDRVDEAGLTLADLADQVNEAYRLNHDKDPGNDVAYYDMLPNSVKQMANAQCEMCHGPGSQHLGNTANIEKPWHSNSCLRCHDAKGFSKDLETEHQPYAAGPNLHTQPTAIFQTAPALLQTACAKCHSAEGFVTLAVEGGTVSQLSPKTQPHGVTCAACHDPHDSSHPNQLRTVAAVTLDSGQQFDGGGKGNLCANCHQSRVPSDLENYIQSSSNGPHFAPQADIMMGVNVWTYGEEPKRRESVHQEVVQDTCVACHMARVPHDGWTDESGVVMGGHSFLIRSRVSEADNHQNACTPCHLTMKSLDRVLTTGRDYDGDGVKEGVQSEVKGLMIRIGQILADRYPGVTVAEDGALNVTASLYQKMTFDEKAAVYNVHMFYRDGSFGIHNASLTVETLQKTYGAIAGTSFAAEFPKAYIIGSTGIEDWPAHIE
ncbi:MAG: hypothetical protein GC154_06790 [bacterium]|nr:hypothetical protein [bacterium]